MRDRLGQEAVEQPKTGRPHGPIYLKALPLRSADEVENIKVEVSKRNIVILRVTPLAHKNVEELRRAVQELYEYVEGVGGDIARLGEDRIVITPPEVKIWRGLL
jgi:SepF-like predicted cell division protein (DUF552 family)